MQFGLPPFQKTIPSSEFAVPDFFLVCNNSAEGPVLNFFCKDCIVAFDNYFVEQDFVDTVSQSDTVDHSDIVCHSLDKSVFPYFVCVVAFDNYNFFFCKTLLTN